MINKSPAERKEIARRAAETRRRNLRLAASGGKSVPSSSGSTWNRSETKRGVVHVKTTDNDVRIAIALIVQKLGIEFPPHLADVGAKLMDRLTPPPPPAAPPVQDLKTAFAAFVAAAQAGGIDVSTMMPQPADKPPVKN